MSPMPPGHHVDTEPLSPNDYEALRPHYATPAMRELFDVLWYSGLRITEALRLQAGNIQRDDETGRPVGVHATRLKKRAEYHCPKCKTRAAVNKELRGQAAAGKLDCAKCGTTVTEKARETDFVPLPDGLLTAIAKRLGKAIDEPRSFLFPGRDGAKPVTQQAAWKALRSAGQSARRAGARLRGDVHPHRFRHGFGRQMAELRLTDSQGNPLPAMEHLAQVQRMLGHSDPKTTIIYFRPTDREVVATWRQMQESQWREA